jgi:hypothetical protein
MSTVSIVTPILIVILGACGWWLIRYLNAPRPFEVALFVVCAVLLLLWLLAALGGVDVPLFNVTPAGRVE